MRRTLDRTAAEREPHLVWNAFIDLIAMEDYPDLSQVQRLAHLVFWYDSEVQNGGHGQYFENRGTHHLRETVEALRVLGLVCQADVLRQAATAAISSAMEFTNADTDYHACLPTTIEALRKHLEADQEQYVELA